MKTADEKEGLSRFAHDFGSPLTAIRGAARTLALLLQGASPDEQLLLEIIERNCQRLMGVVERVLAATEVEGDTIRVTLTLPAETGGEALPASLSPDQEDEG